MGNKKKHQRNARELSKENSTANTAKGSPKDGIRNRHLALGAVILGLFAFFLYINTLKNDFVLDDTSAIQYNSFVRNGYKGIPKILTTEYRAGYWAAKGNLYRPLPLVVFAVIWKSFPENPAPFHLFNCFIFGLSAVLLFLLLARLLQQFPLLIPFFITLLFVVHPIHTEAVANIKSLDELLSLFFCLLGSMAMIQFLDTRNKIYLALLSICYFLALCSKEGAITFVLIFPLMMYFFTTAKKSAYLFTCTAFGIAAVVYLLLRNNVLTHQTGMQYQLQVVDNSIIAAKDFAEKTASCFANLGRYLLLCLYPHPLSVDYSYNQIPVTGWSNPAAILSFLVYVAMGVIVLLRWKRKEAWVFGILFFLITISLYSNLFYTIGTNFAERLLYIPSLGICITFVILLNQLLPMPATANQNRFKIHSLAFSILMILSIAGMAKTFDRNSEWKNLLSLCETDLQATPRSAHLNFWAGKSIADDLQDNKFAENERKKYSDQAISFFTHALDIYPAYGDAFAHRGKQYYTQNMEEQALADYKKAISCGVPIWGVYADLGSIYFKHNQLDSALLVLQKGITIDRSQTELYRYIGVIYQRLLRYNDAINYLNQAIAIDPSQALLYKDMATNYHLQGQYDEALNYYLGGLKRLKPQESGLKKDIYANLVKVYRAKGDLENSKKYESQ